MISHRGDGIPTQYRFDPAIRDAAQVLMTAALSAQPSRDDGRIKLLCEALEHDAVLLTKTTTLLFARGCPKFANKLLEAKRRRMAALAVGKGDKP